MITHASALEALAEPQAAGAFDEVAEAWINDRDCGYAKIEHQLTKWLDYAEDLRHMTRDNYRLPSSMMPDDGRIAGVTESAVQETMEL